MRIAMNKHLSAMALHALSSLDIHESYKIWFNADDMTIMTDLSMSIACNCYVCELCGCKQNSWISCVFLVVARYKQNTASFTKCAAIIALCLICNLAILMTASLPLCFPCFICLFMVVVGGGGCFPRSQPFLSNQSDTFLFCNSQKTDTNARTGTITTTWEEWKKYLKHVVCCVQFAVLHGESEQYSPWRQFIVRIVRMNFM